MDSAIAVSVMIGFALGVAFTGFVFYGLYRLMATEVYNELQRLSKTVGFLGAKVTHIGHELDERGVNRS